jgi:hypothetical protein
MSLPRHKQFATPEERAQELANIRSRRRHGTAATKRGRRPTVDPEMQQRVAMILKIAGYTERQIAYIVNSNYNTVNAWFTKQQYAHVQEEFNILKRSITNAAHKLLEAYMLEAIQAIADVMRTSEDSQMILKAAGDILDRAGMPKVSRQERKTEEEHHHDLTSGGESLLERLRDAPPEIQEQAAKGIEQIEKLLSQSSQESQE